MKATLPLIVIKGHGASLLGRNWLASIKLNWSDINAIVTDNAVQELVGKHSKLFRSDFGTLQGVEAKILFLQTCSHNSTNSV